MPAALPTDKDFGFTSDPTELARAYESGWLACRMIAEQWGAARLAAFYRAVGTRTTRPGAVESALHHVLGLTPDAFTTRWQKYVKAQLG